MVNMHPQLPEFSLERQRKTCNSKILKLKKSRKRKGNLFFFPLAGFHFLTLFFISSQVPTLIPQWVPQVEQGNTAKDKLCAFQHFCQLFKCFASLQQAPMVRAILFAPEQKRWSMHFSGPECCWTDMSKHTIWSVRGNYMQPHLLMQRGVLKQLSKMYLKFIKSMLKLFSGSVADVFTF